MKQFGLITFLVLSFFTVFAQKTSENANAVQMFSDNVFALSEVMLHDVANPPAASRFYAYSLLGAYETALYGKGRIKDINSKLKTNPGIQAPVAPKDFNLSFCSNYALLDVGRQLMPSGNQLEKKQKELVEFFSNTQRVSRKSLEEQIRFAQAIAGQVVAYAKTDGYNKLSTYSRYTPNKAPGHWYPTPPEYMGAIEPRWETIRPFFLDSASQFKPARPNTFSKDTTSAFFREMKEVYFVVKNMTQEQKDIANFWDCNPFSVTYSGHMAMGLKKISPGGHWMGITGIACKKANITLDSAILVNTLVALTIHDAFISCWQEKYVSDRIRPETSINKLLDPTWRPLLQTPPFPEYTSGHSVVSSAAAVMLTWLLGDHFSYVDTSERFFGLPERKFNSFNEAASEAVISRLYGGIHFRDACEKGALQGKQVGNFVKQNLER